MHPPYWEPRCGEIASGNDAHRIIRRERNAVLIRELLQISGEASECIIGLSKAKQYATARFAARGAVDALHARDRVAGEQPADVDHFVGLHGAQNALQSARARPLLDN